MTIIKHDTEEMGSRYSVAVDLRKIVPDMVYFEMIGCVERFSINTPLRLAHFIAQVKHESANFFFIQENLNYSWTALISVFGKYFPSQDIAQTYSRQQEKIANRVYAGRMGNGDESREMDIGTEVEVIFN